MQVSSVCAGAFSAIENCELYKNEKNISNADTSLNTFMSNPIKHDSDIDIDSINEWKYFCQNQIMANNLDFLA